MKSVERVISWIPDLGVLAIACLAQAAVVAAMFRRPRGGWRWALVAALAVSWAVMLAGFGLRSGRFSAHFNAAWSVWLRATVFGWTLLSIAWAAVYAILGRFPVSAGFSGSRRGFLQAARAALVVTPAAALGYGVFIQRRNISLREHRILVPGLPQDLDGLRLVQITDIHLSPFFSRPELDYAVALANEARAHVALVTGDLITTSRDPLDDCLDGLKPLRADVALLGCMGNHEIYAGVQDYVEQIGARQGIQFLRHGNQILTFGDARINFAGVDYQRLHRRYLKGAEELVVPGAYNVLLSHNPDVFDVARGQGYDLTISGHTHGGQVRFEILGADLNIARFYTPYVDGLYSNGAASIFVSRGLGTIGIPARLGAPPEVTLLRLCRI